eukprot:gnl/TRDRNA2_/TRDRNA2_33670_c0_seq1.p1 gnl/TRDRNA2_/TRDRNA2_33670_c0~~gnl/TRDRNA2_/TRDRNA2_33670_c0_seq1.p1  ORF type:complete len:126 (-),score=35.48 gnl/TRDRNA2_/TRDRNA2_33670_c0_seq1:92-469(-)
MGNAPCLESRPKDKDTPKQSPSDASKKHIAEINKRERARRKELQEKETAQKKQAEEEPGCSPRTPPRKSGRGIKSVTWSDLQPERPEPSAEVGEAEAKEQEDKEVVPTSENEKAADEEQERQKAA